ncbi:hypothetical protein OESDEN_14047, partial [Oesophagostomum dentatum]
TTFFSQGSEETDRFIQSSELNFQKSSQQTTHSVLDGCSSCGLRASSKVHITTERHQLWTVETTPANISIQMISSNIMEPRIEVSTPSTSPRRSRCLDLVMPHLALILLPVTHTAQNPPPHHDTGKPTAHTEHPTSPLSTTTTPTHQVLYDENSSSIRDYTILSVLVTAFIAL